jgi:predicted Zn-ribbon and HTH transcriptional regulator
MVFRKDLIALLREQPRSVSSLAREVGLKRTAIDADLHHALRSAQAAGHHIHILPARCRACGFEFDASRLAKPGKCPVCRGSRIQEAQIHIA